MLAFCTSTSLLPVFLGTKSQSPSTYGLSSLLHALKVFSVLFLFFFFKTLFKNCNLMLKSQCRMGNHSADLNHILVIFLSLCNKSWLFWASNLIPANNLTISRAPLRTPQSMFENRSPSCPSGNSANSAMGLLSNIKENSSDAALQFVTTGEKPRNILKPSCKRTSNTKNMSNDREKL